MLYLYDNHQPNICNVLVMGAGNAGYLAHDPRVHRASITPLQKWILFL